MKKLKYMTMNEWRKREFAGSGWDNRTIKKLIAEGVIVGILFGNKTLVREDQTLAQLDVTANDLEELIKASA
jgi:hypothetical protein